VRCLLPVMFLLFLIVSPALAEDNLFNSTAVIKGEIVRLGEEAVDVARTPLDTDNHGLVGTLAVAGAVGLTYVFDDDIRTKLQGVKSRNLDKAADAGNVLGNPFLHLGIAAAVYGGGVVADSPKYRSIGEMMGEAVLLADATTFLLKEGIGRGRPFTGAGKGDFKPFQFKGDNDSMPSMHTSSSFAMASVLAATSESMTLKLSYYSAAAFVGFSRMYQDKHWASDVVLGAAIGELCGRVVTNYHASRRNVTLAPLVSGDAAGLVLVGKF